MAPDDRRLRERLEVGRAALLVIDVQNDFCDPRGALGQRGLDLGPAQRMVPRLLSFIAAARAAGLPVLYTQTVHSDWTDSAAWRKRQQSAAGGLCRAESWGAEFHQVAPLPGERVIVKHRYDAFLGTDLDMVLRARGVASLLLTGAATNVCVETTAREAFVRDYELVMIEDCLVGSSSEEHCASLRTLERYFDAAILGSTAAAEILRGDRQNAAR